MRKNFQIQAYSYDGYLRSEKSLDSSVDGVTTLQCAERRAREVLDSQNADPLIVIITEETLTKLRQVQFRLAEDSQ